MKSRQITVKAGHLYRDGKIIVFVKKVQPYDETTIPSYVEVVVYYQLNNPDRIISTNLAYAERVWENVY